MAAVESPTSVPATNDEPLTVLTGDCPAGDKVWASLLTSNALFASVGERPPVEGVSVTHRGSLAGGQSPSAVVVTCADSRLSPELLFARGLGELFVIRTAGNTTSDDSTVASVEYAVKNLGASLVVVLGHTKCGAVGAAVATAADPDAMAEQPRTLAAFVKDKLLAPVQAIKQRGDVDESDFVSACEVENVHHAVRTLLTTSGWLAKTRVAGRVKVVGAMYSLATGLVVEC
ncbi:hypothetical protein MMPV_002957 [Pyropia vietnamensis]